MRILSGLLIALFIIQIHIGAESLGFNQEEQPKQLLTVQITPSKKIEVSKEESLRIDVKPIDIEKVTKKIEDAGDKSYQLLRSGSPFYFVIVLGIAFSFMLLGLFIKKMMSVGIAGLFIAFFSYIMINFASEITSSIVAGITNFFGGIKK
jgi:hypothetical protein